MCVMWMWEVVMERQGRKEWRAGTGRGGVGGKPVSEQSLLHGTMPLCASYVNSLCTI